MHTQKFKEALKVVLINAYEACLQVLPQEVSGHVVYAFTVFCDSGFRSMGLAFSTQEALSLRNQTLTECGVKAFLNMMNAAEWPYVNYHYELFADADQMIDEFYDCFYDGEFEDIELDAFISNDALDKFKNDIFVEVIISTLNELRAKGAFTGAIFTKDVLLGLQFGDPGVEELSMIEVVSSQVNSFYWHEKVMINCCYIKNGIPVQGRL